VTRSEALGHSYPNCIRTSWVLPGNEEMGFDCHLRKTIVLAMEFKSQAGESIGNNVNNRSEEAVEAPKTYGLHMGGKVR